MQTIVMACLAVNKDAFQKTWNPTYILCKHFDGVRAFVFHHVELVLPTVSEDFSATLELEKK